MPIERGAPGRVWFPVCWLAALLLATLKIVLHLHFWQIPTAVFVLGLVSYRLRPRLGLELFLVLLPLLGATPALLPNGYPFNYMGVPLFYLSGLVAAALLRREQVVDVQTWAAPLIPLQGLALLSCGALFLRWSGWPVVFAGILPGAPVSVMTLPGGHADSVSFASIFPVIALFLLAAAPFALFLVRRQRLTADRVFALLSIGLAGSLGVALLQRLAHSRLFLQPELTDTLRQYNGASADFNALGFMAGVIFLYHAAALLLRFTRGAAEAGRPWGSLAGMAVALAAIAMSGSRTAFFFVLAAVVLGLCLRGIRWRVKLLALALVIAALAVAGGTLTQRLLEMGPKIAALFHGPDWFDTMNRITNQRMVMLRDSLPMIARYPVTGVGLGNFIFYRRYLHVGQEFYEDLPLNQYLLVGTELGLLALGLFLLALWRLWRQPQPLPLKAALAAVACAFLFSTPLWVPELAILFWLLPAFADPAPPLRPWPRWADAALIGVALLFTALHHQALHPATWAAATGQTYRYGVWDVERPRGDRAFCWTGEKAGLLITSGTRGRLTAIALRCGAPLALLPGRQQEIVLSWRGHPFRRLVFLDNGTQTVPLPSAGGETGALEIEVRPTFVPADLHLGADYRRLGVQWLVE
jgi:hypothetical protein